MSHKHILGIDVAKAKLDIALLLPDGKFRSEVIANTPEGFKMLAVWLERSRAAQVHACMEATGIYWESAALSRTKTDKKDARLIARFCAERRPPLWEPSAPEISELRALVTRRDALERMRPQEINRLHVACGQVRSGVEEHIVFLEKASQDIDSENRRRR